MRDLDIICYNLQLPSEVYKEIQNLDEDFTTTDWEEKEKLAAITLYVSVKFDYPTTKSAVAEEFQIDIISLQKCLKEVIDTYEVSQAEYVQQIVQFSSYNKTVS